MSAAPHAGVLCPGSGPAGRAAEALVGALLAAGYPTAALRPRTSRALESLLARRGFTEGLTRVPAAAAALAAHPVDVVHAFTPADALAARAWRRARGGPVVFTCAEPLARASVADRRLRLRLLASAVEESDAVLVPDAATAAALRRWMAVDAQVVPAADAAAHATVYRAAARR